MCWGPKKSCEDQKNHVHKHQINHVVSCFFINVHVKNCFIHVPNCNKHVRNTLEKLCFEDKIFYSEDKKLCCVGFFFASTQPHVLGRCLISHKKHVLDAWSGVTDQAWLIRRDWSGEKKKGDWSGVVTDQVSWLIRRRDWSGVVTDQADQARLIRRNK